MFLIYNMNDERCLFYVVSISQIHFFHLPTNEFWLLALFLLKDIYKRCAGSRVCAACLPHYCIHSLPFELYACFFNQAAVGARVTTGKPGAVTVGARVTTGKTTTGAAGATVSGGKVGNGVGDVGGGTVG